MVAQPAARVGEAHGRDGGQRTASPRPEAMDCYMEETTPEERRRIHHEQMARQGLVWHNGRWANEEEAAE